MSAKNTANTAKTANTTATNKEQNMAEKTAIATAVAETIETPTPTAETPDYADILMKDGVLSAQGRADAYALMKKNGQWQEVPEFVTSEKPEAVDTVEPDMKKKKQVASWIRKACATIKRARLSADEAVSSMCYDAVKKAYSERNPWIVDRALHALKNDAGLSDYEMDRCADYFRDAGFKISTGVHSCLGIIDYSQQADAIAKMKGVLVFSYKTKRRENSGAKSAAKAVAKADAGARANKVLARLHDTAEKNAEAASKAKDKEAEAFHRKEIAVANATKAILALLKDEDDPLAIAQEFRAWLESKHAKELEAAK